MGIINLRRELALERNIVVLGTTSMIAIFGNYLWFFFLPNYYSLTFGASSYTIGIIYGTWFLAVGLGSAPAGALADKIGRKKIVVVSGIISSASIFLLAFASSKSFFILSAIAFPLSGVGTSFMQISNVMIAETVEKGRRGVAFGTFQTFAYVAGAFSPLLGGIAIFQTNSFTILFLVGASLTLFATVLRALFLRETLAFGTRGSRRTFDFRKSMKLIFRTRELLVLLVIFSMYDLLIDQNSFVMPLYTSRVLGLGSIEQGAFFAVLVAVVAAFRLPSGKLSDRIGKKKTILISWIGESSFVYLIVFSPRGDLPFALLGVAVWMLFGVMDAPAANAWLSDAAAESSRGFQMGTFYSVTSLVALPGALITGILFSISPQLPFYANSAMGMLALVLLLTLARPALLKRDKERLQVDS